VVIPCYNYGHFLGDAVSSVLDDQPGVDVRVLIIDDASPDGSGDTAREMAANDPRVEAVVHTSNRGHIATYNEGLLDWADAEYSVLMSADDQLTPGSLRRAVALLEANPGVGFAYGYALAFRDATSKPTPRTSVQGWSVWAGPSWLERRCRLARSGILSPEVVVRTSLQQRVGGYNEKLPHHGDTEMWMRLASVGDVGYLRGVDQAFYRRHSSNMSSSYDLNGATALRDLEQRQLAFDTILEQLGQDPAETARLVRLVRRKLAWEALFTAARAYDDARVAQTPVDDLLTFATACWPDVRSMPIYHTLKLRRCLGPRAMAQLARFLPPERAARFFAESGDRYDTVWEAVAAVAMPGRQPVRFA
jgi:GT2 family glycosyltransferase